jgi:hypothetical protein
VSERSLGLAIGSVAWAGVCLAYTARLLAKGRSDVARALVYNLPIAFLFLVVASTLAVRALRLGLFEFLRSDGVAVILWLLGLGVLYLRLVSKGLEVSGHLAWLPMLTVQSWMLGLPGWLVGVGIGATASAAYLKFAVFQGPSGGPGLAVGWHWLRQCF